MEDSEVTRAMLLGLEEEQVKLMADIASKEMDEMDCYIGIRASNNISESSDVPSEKSGMFSKLFFHPVHHEIRVKKTKWVILRYPNGSMAQLANMSNEAFEDFFFDVCTLDYKKMGDAMQSLVNLMNNTDKVRIVAKDTDISFSIKGIGAVPCCGKRNIPDGEVYSAPVRETVNGVINIWRKPTCLRVGCKPLFS